MQYYDESSFLSEAIWIGDNIIDNCKKNESGIYWESLNALDEYTVEATLYSGVSGTLFFLIELYKKTNDDKYYEVIVGAANWLISNRALFNTYNFNYFTGDGGITIVLLKVHKLTGDIKYKDAAIEIFHTRITNDHYRTNDILTGSAGGLLSLICLLQENQLSSEIKPSLIVNEITKIIHAIINTTIVTDKGFCWDRIGESVHPLCGFSHGVSGIAFIFFELYKIFHCDFFLWIAQNAVVYENKYYSNEYENWPDFRKDTITTEGIAHMLKAYDNNDFGEFEPWYMSAWCHGSPGIAMQRIRAYQTTKTNVYLDDYRKSISSISKIYTIFDDSRRDFTLCHGLLGIANLYIDGYVVLSEHQLYVTAKEWGTRSCENRRKYGSYKSGYHKNKQSADSSLFVGNAGIGHFFLRLVDPYGVDSVFLPQIKLDSNTNIEFPEHLIEHLTTSIYEQLFTNSSKYNKDASRDYRSFLNSNYRNEINNTLYLLFATKGNINMINALARDNMKFKLFDEIKNDSLLKIRQYKNISKAKEFLLAENAQHYKLRLNEDLTILVQEIDSTKQYFIFLKSWYGYGVIEFAIGKLEYDLLNIFRNNKFSSEAYMIFIDSYNLEDSLEVRNLYSNRIREFVNNTFLILS